LICDPALVISADRIVHIQSPGDVGENTEQIHKLLRGQSTVSVLKQIKTSFSKKKIQMIIQKMATETPVI